VSGDTGERTRIPRVAKGERPRHLADPALDTLVGIVVALIGEVSVLRDRVATLERALDEGGVLPRTALEGRAWSAGETAERAADRAAYLERVLRAARAEAEELATGRVARPLEEIVADLVAGRF